MYIKGQLKWKINLILNERLVILMQIDIGSFLLRNSFGLVTRADCNKLQFIHDIIKHYNEQKRIMCVCTYTILPLILAVFVILKQLIFPVYNQVWTMPKCYVAAGCSFVSNERIQFACSLCIYEFLRPACKMDLNWNGPTHSDEH